MIPNTVMVVTPGQVFVFWLIVIGLASLGVWYVCHKIKKGWQKLTGKSDGYK